MESRNCDNQGVPIYRKGLLSQILLEAETRGCLSKVGFGVTKKKMNLKWEESKRKKMYSEKQLEYFKRMIETGKCKSEKQREHFERVIGMKEEIEGEMNLEIGTGTAGLIEVRSIGTDTGEERREAEKIKKREYMRERRAREKAQ